MSDENQDDTNISRRDMLKYGGTAGVIGMGGFTTLSASSEPTIAAGANIVLSDSDAGTDIKVDKYDITFDGLDTSKNIKIAYVFNYQSGSDRVDGFELNIDNKSGTVTAENLNGTKHGTSTTITVPDKLNVTMGIEIDHASLSGTVSAAEASSPLNETTISPTSIERIELLPGGTSETVGFTKLSFKTSSDNVESNVSKIEMSP